MLKQYFAWLAVGSVIASSLTLPLSAISKSESKRPHMDLAFCIDTTGSMQNEIEMVKTKTKEIVAKLASGTPAPVVRVGLVAYRDRGDEYVTKVFQFTDDIDKVVKDISSLTANGGGDAPESVNEALHVAVHNLSWDKDKHTAKLLFLIGDAGPHAYPNDYDWKTESKTAISDGIQINTIACSGLEAQPQGREVFEQIAKLADGKFDTLAYRQEIVDSHGHKSTMISSGGAAYRLKDSGKGDWKASVASGALESMPATPMAAPMAAAMSAPASAIMPMGGVGGAVRAKAMMATGRARDTMGAFNAPSREESNLDDLVLNAAKNKASKTLNVNYK